MKHILNKYSNQMQWGSDFENTKLVMHGHLLLARIYTYLITFIQLQLDCRWVTQRLEIFFSLAF